MKSRLNKCKYILRQEIQLMLFFESFDEDKFLHNEKIQKYLIAFVDTENISPDGTSGLISLIDYKYRDYGKA